MSECISENGRKVMVSASGAEEKQGWEYVSAVSRVVMYSIGHSVSELGPVPPFVF